MTLPDGYTYNTAQIPKYFESIKNAQPPERFTIKFLEKLDFKSKNDRLIIGILKDLGFIDSNGKPKQRYYDFLDRTNSKKVLGVAICEAYKDLFSVNIDAYNMNLDNVNNKLRTLYEGKKTDGVISQIAKTFLALCRIADFSVPQRKKSNLKTKKEKNEQVSEDEKDESKTEDLNLSPETPVLTLDSLQYNINIVLPESRDQAVYDAIFKSLRSHLR